MILQVLGAFLDFRRALRNCGHQPQLGQTSSIFMKGEFKNGISQPFETPVDNLRVTDTTRPTYSNMNNPQAPK